MSVTATFLTSAASVADFPRTGLPEIALLGRSNVGKSSLINALLNRKIARTSAAPGKTRLANFYEVSSAGSTIYLVDLPGYGYARGGRDATRAFESLVSEYFDVRGGKDAASLPSRHIAGVLQVIDARHPDLAHDAAAHAWLSGLELPLAVVATKIDKLTRSARGETLRQMAALYGPGILPTSASRGEGLKALWQTVADWTQD